MADITLVNLNMLYLRYYDKVEREYHVPLGCLYLSRALEDAGFSVDFRDYQLATYDDPFRMESLVDFCRDPAPVIGLSCMANLLPFTILAVKALREAYPESRVVIGGVGPKSVERRVLEKFPWVEAIARGEGERSAPLLLRALLDGSDLAEVPGVTFRSNGSITETELPERIQDLDTIPFPMFEKVNLADYEGYGLMSSRGCPYPCTFCSVAPIWGRKALVRSDENIIEEMKLLNREAGADLFLFQDEFFVSGPDRVMSFCTALSKSGLDVAWKAFGRVDLVNEKMMHMMADNGCVELRFGIESGCDRILEATKKGFNSAEAVEVISKAVEMLDRVDTFFMWGFPFETMDEFHQTVFQMVSFRMMGARILPSLLCILPQTEIYEEWRDRVPLEFCPELIPEYMLTGHEICGAGKIAIDEAHKDLYNFISSNPDIFPGFFHINMDGNVRPKLRVLQEFGFYASEPEKDSGTDSCGAHSPKTEAALDLATRPAHPDS